LSSFQILKGNTFAAEKQMCSEDASDVAPVPLVGSHSFLPVVTNDLYPLSTKAVKHADSQHSLVEESVGTGRTDTEGSLDVNEVAWPKIPPEQPVTKNTGKADTASSVSFQQPCQATYGQPSSLNQLARLSRPSSAASRPSPAPSHYAPSRSVESIPAVLRPNYPEGPIQEEAFSRQMPPSSQRMVLGMNGVELSQVPASISVQVPKSREYVQDDRLIEETKTPALSPHSTFASQPKVAQSVSRNPAETGISLRKRNKRVQSKTVFGPPQQSATNFTPVAISDLPNDQKPKQVLIKMRVQ